MQRPAEKAHNSLISKRNSKIFMM